LLIAGVGLATTVSAGAAAKAALGASSTGLGATRTSIDKNFFYEKTVPALITARNAQWKVALVPILEGTKRDTEGYPMALALSDLAEYYYAGTFTEALQAIEKDAGVKEASGQAYRDCPPARGRQDAGEPGCPGEGGRAAKQDRRTVGYAGARAAPLRVSVVPLSPSWP